MLSWPKEEIDFEVKLWTIGVEWILELTSAVLRVPHRATLHGRE